MVIVPLDTSNKHRYLSIPCISHHQTPGHSLLLGLCGQRPCWTGRPFQRPPVDSSSGGCGHLHSLLPLHLLSCGGGDLEGLLWTATPKLTVSIVHTHTCNIMGINNLKGKLGKLLCILSQGGVTPIRPVLALATGVKILDCLF